MNNNTQHYQENNKREIPFIHPGIILSKEMLKGKGISQKKLALETNISLPLIKEICQGKKDIDKNTGQKLSYYFQINKDFWINLQNQASQKPHQEEINQLGAVKKKTWF